MKTEILGIKGTWLDVLNDCRNTVSKEPLNKEPSDNFKKSILISEHSPIRDISIRWRWESIKSWVATHWVRHKWECFVSTRRTDRTGIDRNSLRQDELVSMVGDANIQQLIDTARKRLCYQASSETRDYMVDLKISIHNLEPDISNVLVPNCIYRMSCPEMSNCGFINNFINNNKDINIFDIQERYNRYNELFYKKYETGIDK